MLFLAHDINTPLTHVSNDVRSAFDTYFSRFLDIEEPPLVPLNLTETRCRQETASSSVKGPKEKTTDETQVMPSPTEEPSGWLQTYVSHLSGDIRDGENTGGPETQMGILPPSRMASPTEITVLGGSGGLVDEDANGTGLPVLVSNDAEGVMGKGFTPPPSTSNALNGLTISQTLDMDDFYPELFNQIPSLGDFIGMGHEIPIFPGLGGLLDGEDIWSGVLDNNML